MKSITTISEFLADTSLAALPVPEARLVLLHLNAGKPMGESLDLASRFSRLTEAQQADTLARQRAGLTLSDAMIATLANSTSN